MDLELVGEWAERERAVTPADAVAVPAAPAAAPAVAGVAERRPRMGLDVGDALPLTWLSPMTRTMFFTDTPCSSGGTVLLINK